MSLRDDYDVLVSAHREAETASRQSPDAAEKDLCTRIGRCYRLYRSEAWDELLELVKPDKWVCDDLSGHPYEVVADDKTYGRHLCRAHFVAHVEMPAGGHYLVHPASNEFEDYQYLSHDWFVNFPPHMETPKDGIMWALHNQRVRSSNRQRCEEARVQCIQDAEQRVQLVRELSAGCSQEHVGSDKVGGMLFRDGWFILRPTWTLGAGTYEQRALEFIRVVNGD